MQNLYYKTYKIIWKILVIRCIFALFKNKIHFKFFQDNKQQEHIYLNFGYEDGVLL